MIKAELEIKKAPPERTTYQNGKHVATAKLIAQR
jgi:hypothetical protein